MASPTEHKTVSWMRRVSAVHAAADAGRRSTSVRNLPKAPAARGGKGGTGRDETSRTMPKVIVGFGSP